MLYELQPSTIPSVMGVQLLHPDAQMPTRAHPDDAGFDLYCVEDVEIHPMEFMDLHLGIAIQPPPGIYCRLIGRSSTYRRRELLCIEGTIDEGYRGELFAAVLNMNPEVPHQVHAGERLVQLIPMINVARHIMPTEKAHLDETTRGARGFGSTGE